MANLTEEDFSVSSSGKANVFGTIIQSGE